MGSSKKTFVCVTVNGVLPNTPLSCCWQVEVDEHDVVEVVVMVVEGGGGGGTVIEFEFNEVIHFDA